MVTFYVFYVHLLSVRECSLLLLQHSETHYPRDGNEGSDSQKVNNKYVHKDINKMFLGNKRQN